MEKIVEQCYEKSVELLINNSTDFGVLASSSSERAKTRNYLSIFGRDASICSLGMIASKNKELLSLAKKSLDTLGKYQAKNGQIPNYVKPEKDETDFWHFGCIDATLWWLIAVGYYNKNAKPMQGLEKKIKKAINWLYCNENPKFKMLPQNEGSDWADIMPRSGYVLYTNTLWVWVKNLYNLSDKNETKENFNFLFNTQKEPTKKLFDKNRRFARLIINSRQNKNNEILVSFVTRYNLGNEMDVYGNLLAIISNSISDRKEEDILKIFLDKKANKPFPVKTVLNPIKVGSLMWRPYMKDHNQNLPDQYHNGGIWPFIGGFWVIALKGAGFNEVSKKELANLAMLNKKGNWAFNEWFHGKTGRAMGKRGQSWNAGAYLLAYHFIKGDFKF